MEESKILLFQPRSSFKRRTPGGSMPGSGESDPSAYLPPEVREALRQLREGVVPTKKKVRSKRHLRLVKNDDVKNDDDL